MATCLRVLALWTAFAALAPGQGPQALETTDDRLRRLEAMMSGMAAENRRLADQNRQLADQNQAIERQYRDLADRHEELRRVVERSAPTTSSEWPAPPSATLPGPAPTPTFSRPWPGPMAETSPPRDERKNPLIVDFDEGFLLATEDDTPVPFQLRINNWNQFRYTGFARAVTDWTDSAGVTRPINPRNDFQVNRGRIIFSGLAFDPRFRYNVTIDYNTLRRQNLDLINAWFGYDFSRAFTVRFGKDRVLGVREWQTGASDTLGLERSMATTFFRPSFTAGIWASGEPVDGLFYSTMVGNGFNTASLDLSNIDDNFVYSGDLRWEPLGEFGRYFGDLEWHETPVLRLGNNFVYSKQEGPQEAGSGPEQTLIRLSDGTNLTDIGALAPNVTVQSYHVNLYTIDLGLKFRGLSLSGEYFLRWLQDIRGDGPIPASRRNLFDHGAYAQAGYFLIPQRFELYGRLSEITGLFGNGSEYAGGLNWYPRSDNSLKLTIDVTKENHSPTTQDRTGYQAGASGVLIRAQVQTRF